MGGSCLPLVCSNKFMDMFQNERKKKIRQLYKQIWVRLKIEKASGPKMGSPADFIIIDSYLDSIKSVLQPIIKQSDSEKTK